MRSSSAWTRILVPLDGSPAADRAIPYAEHLARAANAELALLHVGGRQEFLDSAVAELTQRRVAARATQVDGQPGTTIPTVAGDVSADLIVMSTHGRSGLGRAFLGSVAQDVLWLATQPVLLVPPHCERRWDEALGPVIVPLDGSDLAARALAPAEHLAVLLGTSMTLLRVVPFPRAPLSTEAVVAPTMYGMAPYALEAPPSPTEVEESLSQARPYIQQIADQLSAKLPVTADAQVGDAAEVICDVAAEQRALAIVMATHGRTGVGQLLFGSVANSVLQKATFPVLVVGPASADQHEMASQI